MAVIGTLFKYWIYRLHTSPRLTTRALTSLFLKWRDRLTKNKTKQSPREGVARWLGVLLFGGPVRPPENVSKNPKFEGVAKKTRIFFQKHDLRWGMEYISFFSKIKLFFTKKDPILRLRYRFQNTTFFTWLKKKWFEVGNGIHFGHLVKNTKITYWTLQNKGT